MLQDVDGIAGYVTVRKASKVLGISPTAMQRRIQRGQIPALRVERTLLVRKSDVRLAAEPNRPRLRLASDER